MVIGFIKQNEYLDAICVWEGLHQRMNLSNNVRLDSMNAKYVSLATLHGFSVVLYKGGFFHACYVVVCSLCMLISHVFRWSTWVVGLLGDIVGGIVFSGVGCRTVKLDNGTVLKGTR